MFPIYLFPGMTTDVPLFDRLLPLLPGAQVVGWLEPLRRESLCEYARRMAASLTVQPCALCGVSFGGMVAVEVARVIRPRVCFLISSVRDPSQMPPWLRACRLFAGRHCDAILAAAGRLASAVPGPLRSRTTLRVSKLAGPVGAWQRWASSAVLGWRPDPRSSADIRLFQMHGDGDTTFPVRYTKPDVIVRRGGHLLTMTHPQQIATTMLEILEQAV